ncbi:MAG: NAD(P)-dependent alcohol dehydrogenase [Thermoanaerobaculales bacterium]
MTIDTTSAARGAAPPMGHARTMQAITQERYGAADVLRLSEIQRPTAGTGEVIIEVRAAGVDRGVWHLMTGLPYLIRLLGYGLRRPSHPVLGMDVSGTVVAAGVGVERISVGDEVFGIARGAYAEYAVAEEGKLAHKPENLTFEQAAVAAISGITALQALTDVGRIEPGMRVLVIGASGGVGTYTVQLAKAMGATVTGVASGAKADLVRSLGADYVVDYVGDDYLEGAVRYDLIIDIGGRNPLRRIRRALRPNGTLVIVGGEGGDRWTGGIGRQLRTLVASLFVPQRMTMFISSEAHTHIERLATYLEAGSVVPTIGQRFTLANVAEAMRQLEAGRIRGKAVVVVSEGAEDAR